MIRAWSRIIAGVLVAAGAAALVALAPGGLRRMDAFRVDRVEIVGTRYLAPHAALEASRITAEANVFDDPANWRGALEAMPAVDSVDIERRLPGTIVLHITETHPVAWIRTPELRMVDARGRVLSVGPGGAVDLPVVSLPTVDLADGRVRSERALKMIRLLSGIMDAEPRLAARISEVRAVGPDAARLILRKPAGAELLLPMAVTAARLHALRLTLTDLARKNDIDGLVSVDLRFRDQIVVSFGSNRTG